MKLNKSCDFTDLESDLIQSQLLKGISVSECQCQCPFHELDYFDVNKAFPPDIMHDVLEGVLPLVMKLVIAEARKQRHITIREFNDGLKELSIHPSIFYRLIRIGSRGGLEPIPAVFGR